MLSRGADPNTETQQGATPLISAAVAGHLDMVVLLLGMGAHINHEAKTGSTAMLEAKSTLT